MVDQRLSRMLSGTESRRYLRKSVRRRIDAGPVEFFPSKLETVAAGVTLAKQLLKLAAWEALRTSFRSHYPHHLVRA
jgi:hypothetical protein